MELIKKTKSLCPECLKEIDASVFEKDGGVWMQKECKKHGESWGFVENDVDFYKKTMNEGGELCPLSSVVVPITHKCNLNCSFCFVPNRSAKDKPIKEIKEGLKNIIKNNKVFSICLSGGEPTLRDDLFEIIRFLKKEFPFIYVNLLTNGIKLADPEYVRKLKESGLDRINFSFNGFKDYIYKKINNANLFEIKKKALKNIKDEKIAVAFSPTLVRGLNEGELKPIFDFAIGNLDFIDEVRIRGAARVGRHDQVESLTASEMLGLVEDSLGLNRGYFLCGFSKKDCYHSAYSFHVCLFIFQKKNERKIIGWIYAEKRRKLTFGNFAKIIKIFFCILSGNKIINVFNAAFKSGVFIPTMNKCKRDKKIIDFLKRLNVFTLKINIWHWADKNNIDLQEIMAWGMKHVTFDGRILSFSEAVIRAEEL